MRHLKVVSIILGLLFILLFLSCSQESPMSHEKTVDFNMNFVYQDKPLLKSLGFWNDAGIGKNKTSSGPILELNRSYNKARVMVIDMSGYGGWVDIWETEEYHDYQDERDEVNAAGGLKVWSDYERLIDKYFHVTANKTITITADSAVGQVDGVVGANYIVATLTEGDSIRYWGETGQVILAEAGTTQNITIYISKYGDWVLDENDVNGVSKIGDVTKATVGLKKDELLLCARPGNILKF